MEQQFDIEELQPDREEHNSSVQKESNKRQCRRLNQIQTDRLESYFNDFPKPNPQQRKILADELNLPADQVYNWFRNKRTRVKKKQEHGLQTQLQDESLIVTAENLALENDLLSAPCLGYGEASDTGEVLLEEQTFVVNNMLTVKVDKIQADQIQVEVAKCLETQSVTIAEDTTPVRPHLLSEIGTEPFKLMELNRLGVSRIFDYENQVIVELAENATHELIKMTKKSGSLWIPDLGNNQYVVNEEEYHRMVSLGTRLEGFKCETSRDSSKIMADANYVIGLLMNVDKWSSTFSEIISRAMSTKTLSSTGENGSSHGELKVIIAELQAISEFVPTREVHFVRYCKDLGGGTWIVTDACLDVLCADLSPKCRRRTSGCLIQDLPDKCSLVTWVENFEVHGIQNANSYSNFGARRWLSSLKRHCERQKNASATPLSEEYPVETWNLFLLAERMVIGFHRSLHSSSNKGWDFIPGSGIDGVKLMFRKFVGYPGRPSGIVVQASTSLALPYSPREVLRFLSDISFRHKWDVIFYGGEVQERRRFKTCSGAGNCISVMQSVGGINDSTMMIQETMIGPAGSLVVFAPVDSYSMDLVIRGSCNPNTISLLPSGFSILPSDANGDGGSCRSLITVSYQTLAGSYPDPMDALPLESIELSKELVARTVQKIKDNMGRSRKNDWHMMYLEIAREIMNR